MAADFPTSITNILSYVAAQDKGVPYDVFQKIIDEIIAIETVLGAGSAAGTSFTPTIVSTGGGTPTYTVQVGRYRRFLGLVHVTGRVKLATFNTLAAGGVSIGGLPVNSANITDVNSMAAINWSGLNTAAVHVNGIVPPASGVINLNIVTAAAVSTTAMQKSDLLATSDLIFSAIYPAS